MADQESTVAEGQEPTTQEGQEPVVNEQPALVREAKPAEEAQEATETKEEPVDEANVKQLRREAAKHRNRANDAEAKLKEILDRDKSEQEKAAEAKINAEARATKAELKLMRFEVASAHGLDLKAAEFLTGETREEIEERADELTKLLAEQAKTRTPSFDGGARLTAVESKTPEEAHNDLLLKQLGRG